MLLALLLVLGPFDMADKPTGIFADTLPFTPSKKFIEKGWAPNTFPKESVRAAARATRAAVDAGVLTEELARYVLPNLLTENRAEDFGVNNGHWPSGANRAVGKIMKALGLDDTIAKSDVGNETIEYKKGDVVVKPKRDSTLEGMDYNARLMTAVLGVKAANSKSGTPEEAVQRWNGAGPLSRNHLAKVLETASLLKDPANAEIVKLFQETYGSDLITGTGEKK